jgi:hypothetical protein
MRRCNKFRGHEYQPTEKWKTNHSGNGLMTGLKYHVAQILNSPWFCPSNVLGFGELAENKIKFWPLRPDLLEVIFVVFSHLSHVTVDFWRMELCSVFLLVSSTSLHAWPLHVCWKEVTDSPTWRRVPRLCPHTSTYLIVEQIFHHRLDPKDLIHLSEVYYAWRIGNAAR